MILKRRSLKEKKTDKFQKDTSLGLNEMYITSRNKMLTDFAHDEEIENLKYIQEIESIVNQTKTFVEDLFSGEKEFSELNTKLDKIQNQLEKNYNSMKIDISNLNLIDKTVEKQMIITQEEEKKDNTDYQKKIEELQNELELKELTIQNMEKLYLQLEDIIKENIENGSDDLLTMEQFTDFLNQNETIKNDIKCLEKEKIKIEEEYNKMLKQNLLLKNFDEDFDKNKIKSIFDNLETKEKNRALKDGSIKSIKENQIKQENLINKCNEIKNKIKHFIYNIKALNVDNNNSNFNQHLINLEKKLKDNEFPKIKRLNSFSYKNNNIKIIKSNHIFNKNNNNFFFDEYYFSMMKELTKFCPYLKRKLRNRK